MMHALRTGLILACVVALIACSPVSGPIDLFKGSPHRFKALGAMMLLAFIIGAVVSLAGGD